MLHSTIEEPRRSATPSQLIFADARRARLARIAANAKREAPVVLRKPVEIKPEPKPGPVPAPAATEPWFSIVEEIEPREPRRPSIYEIQQAVARHYGITRSDIVSERRTWNIVIPRQVAAYLAQKLTLRSLTQVGHHFRRDHTTILHAIRKISGLVATDPVLAEQIAAVEVELRG